MGIFPDMPIDSKSNEFSSQFTSIQADGFIKADFSSAFTTALNLKQIASKSAQKCSCPSILICDDDLFQHMFYAKFFLKLVSDSLMSTEEHFKIEMFESGEQLLAKYSSVNTCGCKKLFLVITDFNMGHENIDGVQTVDKLLNSGYGGNVVMRTSEDIDELSKKYTKLINMINEQTFSVLNKSDIKKIQGKYANLNRIRILNLEQDILYILCSFSIFKVHYIYFYNILIFF